RGASSANPVQPGTRIRNERGSGARANWRQLVCLQIDHEDLAAGVDAELVADDEGDLRAIRREARPLLVVTIGKKLPEVPAVAVDQPDLVVGDESDRLAIR